MTGGTEWWALLLWANVHLCVLNTQWRSVAGFVRASHTFLSKVTGRTRARFYQDAQFNVARWA